jgi:hypothetical protein
MKKTPERIAGNRAHHFEHWKDTYDDVTRQMADDAIRLMRICKRLKELERRMVNIDINRRENAIDMSVGIRESDEVFSFEVCKKAVRPLIDEANKMMGQFGLSYASGVKDEEPHK